MTNQTNWTELQDKPVDWKIYNGSDEQIIELQNAEHGFIIKNIYGHLWKEIYFFWHQCPIGSTHYWLIPADPLREMKVRQAMTGQPVCVRQSYYDPVEEHHGAKVFTTTTPDWNIPNAEYSFTEFKD